MNHKEPIISGGEIDIETHPWDAWVPAGARILIMGTFPPQRKRWAMDFYYPNRTNDFWPMMGLIFNGDRKSLYLPDGRNFDLDKIKVLLEQRKIALSDSCHKIRRLAGNASDKFLEVVEPVDLEALLARMPALEAIATTGEKAAGVIAEITGTKPPKMGESVYWPRRDINIWRMPSTSRAYPLPLEKKAGYYSRLFASAGGSLDKDSGMS